MNRLNTVRLGILSSFVVLFAAGCAIEQANEAAEQQPDTEGAEFVSADAPRAPGGSTGKAPMWAHSGSRPESGVCTGCGPLPDPWKMGPLPDPWTSSGGASSSSSSSSGSGASGGGASSGGASSGGASSGGASSGGEKR
jgi:uncharacterized membrane protein YgcG